MELLQGIISRRTVRTYAEKRVPIATVEEIVKLAAHAPSACNRRGWRCILLQSIEDMNWFYQRGGSAVFRNTKQALIVCYDNDTDNSEWYDHIQSAAAFIAYFQLIAHERCIGSCWLCHLPPQHEIAERFDIPKKYVPVAVVTFGHYRDDILPVDQKELPPERILALGGWDFPGNEGEQRISALRKLLRKIYYLLPFRGLLRGLAGRYEKKFDE